MPTVVPGRLLGGDGVRVGSREGLLGWVEEAWLGPSGEQTALAIRTIDGRRGLLVAGEIETIILEDELVVMRRGGRLLELDVPHVEKALVEGVAVLSASWETTGEVLEQLPPPPGAMRRALLALRPWRLAPPPRPVKERPLWQLVAVLYISLALIVTLVIGLAFLVARLVTGNAI